MITLSKEHKELVKKYAAVVEENKRLRNVVDFIASKGGASNVEVAGLIYIHILENVNFKTLSVDNKPFRQ